MIVLDTIVTLRVPRDSTDGFPLQVRADSMGRYWMFRIGELPALFGPDGAFLRILGPRGPGPGEYARPNDLLVVNRDTVIVIDGIERRGQVLDASLAPVRQVSLPGSLRSPIVLSWPTDVVVNAGFATPDAAGWPIHLLSFDAKGAVVTKSFGVGDGELSPVLVNHSHELARSDAGGIWAAAHFTYDLSEWTADGTQVQLLRRRPAWFAFDTPPHWNWRTDPPPPYVVALSHDEQGRLWVFIRMAGALWKEGFARVPEGVREYAGRDVDRELIWGRTMVEIIDPERGRVVARRAVEGYGIGSVAPQRVAFYAVDQAGDAGVVIVSFRLTGE